MRIAKHTETILVIAVAATGPVVAVALWFLSRVWGVPPPSTLMLAVLAVVMPAGVVGVWVWRQHQASRDREVQLFRDLPEEQRKVIGKRAAPPYWTFIVLLGPLFGAQMLIPQVALPWVLLMAPAVGWVLLVGPLIRASSQRRFRLAMRDVAKVPLCGACGYELRSFDQTCSECGWEDDGRRPRRPPRWEAIAVFVLFFAVLAAPLWWSMVFPPTAKRAESAASSKVAELLVDSGSSYRVSDFADVDAPDSGGRRLVTGWLDLADGRHTAVRWAVLLDDDMQPVAWQIDDGVTAHNVEMIPIRCSTCGRLPIKLGGPCPRCTPPRSSPVPAPRTDPEESPE